jgi:iron complex outermembrane receptor protein
VDPNLNEEPTPSWQRVDVGFRYAGRHGQLVLEVENATNELYTQHLSYLRNPFASGQRVWEPGRTVRVGVGAAY